MKPKGISRSLVAVLAIGIIVGSIVTGSAVYFLLQSGNPSQQLAQTPKPAQPLEKFKVIGHSVNTAAIFLVIDAGKDRGIWASNGLDPEFIFNSEGRPNVASDIKEQVASGIKIGW